MDRGVRWLIPDRLTLRAGPGENANAAVEISADVHGCRSRRRRPGDLDSGYLPGPPALATRFAGRGGGAAAARNPVAWRWPSSAHVDRAVSARSELCRCPADTLES